MAKQQPSWEGRGKEFATQATDRAIAQLEEEIQGKRARLAQLDGEPEFAQKLVERSELQQAIEDLQGQLSFARDAVKPRMVAVAGRVGRMRDPVPAKKGCFG